MSEIICTKHRTIMELEVDEPSDGFVLFQTPRDEGDERPLESVIINRDLWLDMGSPSTVTVSVEPGDLLND